MEEVQIISVLRILRMMTCFDVAASTLFIWDYILTFRMEVDLVWKSKWSFMKGLFLFQRYLPFIDTVWLVLYRQTGLNLTKTACRKIFEASGVLMTVGVAASEMIFMIRTLVVWKRNRHLTIILSIFYILYWVLCSVMVSRLLHSMGFDDLRYPGFRGCFVTHANFKNAAVSWIIAVIWDALMLVLMLVPGVQMYRFGGQGRLSKIVYRDGLIYYLYLFILSIINVIIIAILPPQFLDAMTVMTRVIHPMLASRVLLNIRAQAEDNTDSSLVLSELKYNPPTRLSEDQA